MPKYERLYIMGHGKLFIDAFSSFIGYILPFFNIPTRHVQTLIAIDTHQSIIYKTKMIFK